LKSELKKSKSRRRRNVIEKAQSESKTFDAIDVRLYTRENIASRNISVAVICTGLPLVRLNAVSVCWETYQH